MPSRTLAPIATRIAFSVAVFLMLLAGLEVILRVSHALGARRSWSEPDQRIGYRFTPGSRYWYHKENDHPVTGRINSFGWRDTEWTLDKPSGVYRVAVLGDSYVEAFQVESSATFLELAETQLESRTDCRWEFMNFGRSGFSQAEEMIILEDTVLRFSPDLVLLFFFPPNDIADALPETALDGLRPFLVESENGVLALDTSFTETQAFRLRKRLNWCKQNSALLSLAAARLTEHRVRATLRERAGKSNRTPAVETLPGHLSLCTGSPDADFVRGYQLAKRIIAKMATVCNDRNIRFIVVCIDEVYRPEAEQHLRGIDRGFNADCFEEDLQAFSNTIGAGFLGLQSVFRLHYLRHGIPLHFGEWDPETQRPQSGHWNYEGHKLVADALVEKLALTVRCPSSTAEAPIS